MTFSGQKRWIFLPGIGTPGKAWNNGIQEVVGSIPIGSTKKSITWTPLKFSPSVNCPSFVRVLSLVSYQALLLFRSGFPGVIAAFPWLLRGLLVNNPVATIHVAGFVTSNFHSHSLRYSRSGEVSSRCPSKIVNQC